jgi:hypothetical protein
VKRPERKVIVQGNLNTVDFYKYFISILKKQSEAASVKSYCSQFSNNLIILNTTIFNEKFGFCLKKQSEAAWVKSYCSGISNYWIIKNYCHVKYKFKVYQQYADTLKNNTKKTYFYLTAFQSFKFAW